MLNRRQEQLIKLLTEKKDWMTSRELAGYLHVTDRTIRSDVDAVNRQESVRSLSPMSGKVIEQSRMPGRNRRPR